MFKEKVIKEWICLLAIMLAAKGWAVAKEATQGTGTAKKPQWEEYVSKEILFIPWGSRKGEVGLKVTEMCVQGIATETVRYGPSKIEIDKNGNIFIFDEINQRIQRYSREGKQLLSVPLSKAKKKPLLIEKFRSGYQYEIYRIEEYDKEKEYYIIPPQTGIKIRDASNNLLGESKILIESFDVDLVGSDKEGNAYLLLDDTHIGALGPNEWRLEIYKYSKEGRLLAKIKLVDDFVNKLGERDKVKVDKNGNIYQLLCNTEDEKDGVHIIKWEVK